jgi:hypothetical protein
MRQNSEQKLEVEFNVKHSRIVFYYVFDVWRRVRVENFVLNLTFRFPCIVSIFRYISNKMQFYTVYLSLETAIHGSGGASTHHQERIQLYLQHLVLVKP